MIKYLARLKEYKPKLFVSYPSPLATFSEYLISENEKIPSIKAIITSAETLYSWQREIIENAFECKVFDRYGSREFGNIAHECEKHEGYHINVERFFVEIIKENNQPAKIGEIGEIVITDLDNYGFPFIRYKIGDMAVQTNKLCSCGRGLPLLKSMVGRTFDIIQAPNGNRIAGTFWTLSLRAIPGIKNFQIEQKSLATLVVRIVKSERYDNKNENSIRQLIHDKCGPEMNIVIRYVHDIPLTKSGKRKFVFSKLN
jgi:phenylacetate-CoA ligase